MSGRPAESLLHLNFLSHGTVLMDKIGPSRRFFEEFLGLDVVATSEISLAVRLNSNTSIACVAVGEAAGNMEREGKVNSHFGLDMGSPEEVADAHRLAHEHKDRYAMRSIGKLTETKSGLAFQIEDLDGNFWEILNNPAGGYATAFTAPADGSVQ